VQIGIDVIDWVSSKIGFRLSVVDDLDTAILPLKNAPITGISQWS
jgi:hypothetical protein